MIEGYAEDIILKFDKWAEKNNWKRLWNDARGEIWQHPFELHKTTKELYKLFNEINMDIQKEFEKGLKKILKKSSHTCSEDEWFSFFNAGYKLMLAKDVDKELLKTVRSREYKKLYTSHELQAAFNNGFRKGFKIARND